MPSELISTLMRRDNITETEAREMCSITLQAAACTRLKRAPGRFLYLHFVTQQSLQKLWIRCIMHPYQAQMVRGFGQVRPL